MGNSRARQSNYESSSQCIAVLWQRQHSNDFRLSGFQETRTLAVVT